MSHLDLQVLEACAQARLRCSQSLPQHASRLLEGHTVLSHSVECRELVTIMEPTTVAGAVFAGYLNKVGSC